MLRPRGGFPKPWKDPNEYFSAYPMKLPRDYRAAAGPGYLYDVKAAMQFCLLIALGLREHHLVLDIGCGSLRLGRLLIPYLLPGGYYGIDPMEWMIEAGIANEVGEDLLKAKRPVLSNDEGFNLNQFGIKFDFLIAQSVFAHAPRQMIRKCLAEAASAMKSTSIFAATYLWGKRDFAGTEFSPAAPYTLEYFQEAADKLGLVCQEISWPHNGQRWILFAWPNHIDEAVRRANHPLSKLAVALKG